MKLIKLSDDHYILVDNSEIKKGDWIVFPNLKKFVPVQYLGGDLTGYEKRITHSTQPIEEWKSVNYGGDGTVKKKIYNKIKPLSLSEVKELLGVVDVEEKAKDYLFYDYQREWNVPTNDEQYGVVTGYIKGYNQALEDNKERKYTKEDMQWALYEARYRQEHSIEEIIQALQPKTEWEVEFVDGKLKLI